jgi:hypothetical protein
VESPEPCTVLEAVSNGVYRMMAKDASTDDELESLRKYFFELGKIPKDRIPGKSKR